MPVLTISSLPVEADIPGILAELNQELAAVFQCEPQHVWSAWHVLQPGHYAVGGQVAQSQPVDSHSPLVRLLAFEGRPAETREAAMRLTAACLERALSLAPGNVFVEYVEGRAGYVLDGGNIVERR